VLLYGSGTFTISLLAIGQVFSLVMVQVLVRVEQLLD
jgi:tetrahydromethanopterin S-methyltransferase subunit F